MSARRLLRMNGAGGTIHRRDLPMMRAAAGLFLAAVPAIALAQAPANPPVRIRGTIEKLDGQNSRSRIAAARA